MFFACFSVILFARNILPVKEHAPCLDKFLRLLMIFTAFMIPVALVIHFTSAMKMGITTVMITAGIILPAVLISWRKNYRPARYLFLAWVFLSAGTVSTIGRSLGVFPDNLATLYGIQIGSTLEVILLSLGLADYMYVLQKGKEEAEVRNRTLEAESQKRLLAETLNELSKATAVSGRIESISKNLLVYIKKLVSYHHACVLLKQKDVFRYMACCNDNGSLARNKGKQEGELREELFLKVLEEKQP